MRLVERSVERSDCHEIVPRRNDVRFHMAGEPCGAARTISRDRVVVPGHGPIRVHRAHRDGRRCISWRGDARVTDLPGFLVDAVVAGGGHDDDARARRRFDGLHERIGFRGFVNRMTERQVDDVDLQAIAVLDRVLDGAQH